MITLNTTRPVSDSSYRKLAKLVIDAAYEGTYTLPELAKVAEKALKEDAAARAKERR